MAASDKAYDDIEEQIKEFEDEYSELTALMDTLGEKVSTDIKNRFKEIKQMYNTGQYKDESDANYEIVLDNLMGDVEGLIDVLKEIEKTGSTGRKSHSKKTKAKSHKRSHSKQTKSRKRSHSKQTKSRKHKTHKNKTHKRKVHKRQSKKSRNHRR